MKHILLAAALLAVPASVSAAQITLTPASVVASSGFYPGYDFGPGEIFDQQTGPVTEVFLTGYWLNPDNGPAAPFITIDLGAQFMLSSVTLYNTANAFNGDRGTGNFSIFGSNSVSLGQLVAPTLVASGTLTTGVPSAAPLAESFAASGSFRYVSFNPTSVASAVPIVLGIQNNYGLNELKLFGDAVPEPTSWAMMIIGFGVIGAAARRRRTLGSWSKVAA